MAAPQFKFAFTYYNNDGSANNTYEAGQSPYTIPVSDMTCRGMKIIYDRDESFFKTGDQIRVSHSDGYIRFILPFKEISSITYEVLNKIKKVQSNVLFYPDVANDSGVRSSSFFWICKPVDFDSKIKPYKRSRNRITYDIEIQLQTVSPIRGNHLLLFDLVDPDVYPDSIYTDARMLSDEWHLFIGDFTSQQGDL